MSLSRKVFVQGWILCGLCSHLSFLNTLSSVCVDVIVLAFNPAARGRIEGSSYMNFKMLLFQGHVLKVRRWIAMDFHKEMYDLLGQNLNTGKVYKVSKDR